jgi:hypothetical protein
MHKPYIPFSWSAVFQALELTNAERLTLIYLMTGAFPVDEEGRQIEPEKVNKSTTWLAVWSVYDLERLTGANRAASTSLRKKLERSRLFTLRTPYDRERGIAEVWDVTKLYNVTPETSRHVAADAKSYLDEAPPAKRDRTPKAQPSPEPVPTRAPAPALPTFTPPVVSAPEPEGEWDWLHQAHEEMRAAA